jgi:UDP-N-acetylmuramate--alanine ligase
MVAFQPHTYSRTKSLFDQFAPSFKDADVVLLLDILHRQESKISSVSAAQLAATVNKNFQIKKSIT